MLSDVFQFRQRTLAKRNRLERKHTQEQANRKDETDCSTEQRDEETECNIQIKSGSDIENEACCRAYIDKKETIKRDFELSKETKGSMAEKSSANNNDRTALEIYTKVGQRCSKRRKRQAQSKLAYISSSDENLPLSVYLQKENVKVLFSDLSDNDKTFIPASKDLNSTDSEFYSDVSTKTRLDIDFNEKLKKSASEMVFKKNKIKKSKHSTRKQRKMYSEDSTFTDTEVQRVKSSSIVQALVHNAIIRANEGRLDQNLYTNNLKRCPVPRHGNCFFDAALLSGNLRGTSFELH